MFEVQAQDKHGNWKPKWRYPFWWQASYAIGLNNARELKRGKTYATVTPMRTVNVGADYPVTETFVCPCGNKRRVSFTWKSGDPEPRPQADGRERKSTAVIPTFQVLWQSGPTGEWDGNHCPNCERI